MIMQLHAVPKAGNNDSRKGWFAVGDYKKLPNEVGGRDTTEPEQVTAEMRKLLDAYKYVLPVLPQNQRSCGLHKL